MSKTPPIPKDQQNAHSHLGSPPSRDPEVSKDPARGNAGMNLKEQGASGNLRQNTTHAQNVQGR